jgi:hypothetical protein
MDAEQSSQQIHKAEAPEIGQTPPGPLLQGIPGHQPVFVVGSQGPHGQPANNHTVNGVGPVNIGGAVSSNGMPRGGMPGTFKPPFNQPAIQGFDANYPRGPNSGGVMYLPNGNVVSDFTSSSHRSLDFRVFMYLCDRLVLCRIIHLVFAQDLLLVRPLCLARVSLGHIRWAALMQPICHVSARGRRRCLSIILMTTRTMVSTLPRRSWIMLAVSTIHTTPLRPPFLHFCDIR